MVQERCPEGHLTTRVPNRKLLKVKSIFFLFLPNQVFSIGIPSFSNQFFKNLTFLQQNLLLWEKIWFFNSAKPGFAIKTMVQFYLFCDCKTWFCSVKPGFAT